jgi:hypothetical protein
MWQVDLLLGNDHKISNYTTAVSKGMALQTTAVARQWLSSDHMVTPTDTNATMGVTVKRCFLHSPC